MQTANLPLPCQHCDQAPCLTADGAVRKREDGLVIIDPVKAKGHKEILDTCPYGVIYWNEEAQLPQKCTGCAHLIDQGWTDTRCSQVCPTDAIKLVLADDADMAARAAADGLEAFKAGLATRPRVFYKNLHRWTKVFVAGTVVFKDSNECAEGVVAAVTLDGKAVGEATTNNYGDFLIDLLEPGKRYSVTLRASGYKPATVAAALSESVNLGTISLERA